jgi:hypothetical protein
MPSIFNKFSASLALGLLCVAPALRADDDKDKNDIDIQKVTFTFVSGNPNPTQMDIYGSGFGASVKPTVTIDGLLPNVSL